MKLLLLLVAVLFAAGLLFATHESDPAAPLAEIYNSGTKELSAFLIEIDKNHRFENGTTGEAWLVQSATIKGATPIWVVKPTKAEIVWR